LRAVILLPAKRQKLQFRDRNDTFDSAPRLVEWRFKDNPDSKKRWM